MNISRKEVIIDCIINIHKLAKRYCTVDVQRLVNSALRNVREILKHRTIDLRLLRNIILDIKSTVLIFVIEDVKTQFEHEFEVAYRALLLETSFKQYSTVVGRELSQQSDTPYIYECTKIITLPFQSDDYPQENQMLGKSPNERKTALNDNLI